MLRAIHVTAPRLKSRSYRGTTRFNEHFEQKTMFAYSRIEGCSTKLVLIIASTVFGAFMWNVTFKMCRIPCPMHPNKTDRGSEPRLMAGPAARAPPPRAASRAPPRAPPEASRARPPPGCGPAPRGSGSGSLERRAGPVLPLKQLPALRAVLKHTTHYPKRPETPQTLTLTTLNATVPGSAELVDSTPGQTEAPRRG